MIWNCVIHSCWNASDGQTLCFFPLQSEKVPRSRELGNPPRVYNPLLVGSLASETNVNQFKWKARLKLYGWIVQEVPWRKPLPPFAVDLGEFPISRECLLNLVLSAAHCGGTAGQGTWSKKMSILSWETFLFPLVLITGLFWQGFGQISLIPWGVTWVQFCLKEEFLVLEPILK